jgi:hypothetical protein
LFKNYGFTITAYVRQWMWTLNNPTNTWKKFMEFCIKCMYGEIASFTECFFPAFFNIVQTFKVGIINRHKYYSHMSLEIVQLDPTL